MKRIAVGISGRLRAERGLGLLELACVLGVLLTVLIGAAGIVDYLLKSRFITSTVSEVIVDTDIKPFRLTNTFGQTPQISLNQSGIATYLGDTLNELKERFASLGHDSFSNPSNFFIQAAYAEIAIDPHSGAPLGLITEPFSFQESKGALELSAHQLNSTDLGQAFLNLASVSGSGEGVSLYALPTPLKGWGGAGAAHYRDRVVIVGLRGFLNLEHTFTGKVLEMLGMEPVIGHHRAVILRGDFSEQEL